MSDNDFVAKAYLKIGCPYSFKFLLFMSEAHLLNQIEVVACDPDDDEGYEQIKSMLKAATGANATFPTVEIASGDYLADSEGLIDYYAQKNEVVDKNPPTLAFYRRSIYSKMIDMKQEIFELKEQLAKDE